MHHLDRRLQAVLNEFGYRSAHGEWLNGARISSGPRLRLWFAYRASRDPVSERPSLADPTSESPARTGPTPFGCARGWGDNGNPLEPSSARVPLPPYGAAPPPASTNDPAEPSLPVAARAPS